MKALKKLGQGIAGNLGGGKLRNAMGGVGGGKLKKAMGGLGKGMLMGHGGKMKYPGGGRMSNRRLARMLAKYMMGGKMKMEHGGKHYGHGGVHEMEHGGKHYMHGGVHEMEHGGKHYRHGGAHNPDGSPVQNPFDRVVGDEYDQAMADINERAMIRRGDASSATPGEGVTIALGEGSPVDPQTVIQSYIEKNPDMVNPEKKFFMVGNERVFLDKDVSDREFDRRVLQPANEIVGGRRVGQERGDSYGAILDDLMAEFDNYVASFGDEVRNDPKKIQQMRDKFAKDAQSYANQIFDSRGY